MSDNRKQLFLAKPRPDETAEQFADRVLGQLAEAGMLGKDGKLAPEIREAAKPAQRSSSRRRRISSSASSIRSSSRRMSRITRRLV